MGAHLIDGEFQSDRYPTTPRGKVPLSVKDPTAQDLLWEYAQRRRAGDRVLWLFPTEWYSHIPVGLPIVDINFREEVFEPGVTCDDMRFGCLAYGVLGPDLPAKKPAERRPASGKVR